MTTPRQATATRKTTETEVTVSLGLDGPGPADVSTGNGFFDHMLTLLAVHGLFSLSVKAVGDSHVDWHHTVEDVGLVLGDAFSRAVGDAAGITRYGHAAVPMDEALATVTVDVSRRPCLVFEVPFVGEKIGEFDTQLTREFFRAFSARGGLTLHVNVLRGDNDHHMAEAAFKATGRALGQAVAPDPRVSGAWSTKGVL